MAETVGYWPRKAVTTQVLHIARFDILPRADWELDRDTDVFEYTAACGAKTMPQTTPVKASQLNIAPTAKAVLELVDSAQRARLCARCVARVRAAA